MRRHLLAIAVILTVATGCDNVVWGGVELELQPPPTSATAEPSREEPAQLQAAERAVGPLLLAGTRDGSRATLAVIGEVDGDALAPFPNPDFLEQDSVSLASLAAVGSEWTLFAEGVRVGRLIVDEVAPALETCAVRASLSGTVELVPDAAGADRLLALPSWATTTHRFGEYQALQRDYDQGVASLNIAGEVIPRVGAPWPDQGTLAARQDIQAFQMAGVSGQAVAATFLHRDALEVAPAQQGAYAVFVMALSSNGGYQEAYSWYRAADVDGKGAPRYFSHLDWDGDGDSEILLEVLGSSRRWYAGLAQRGSEWVRTFQDACGSASIPGE